MFAQPPDISYPTCLAAAPTGELYVGVDENGSLDAKPGRGRVVRCIDIDGDGKADKFNVFAKMDSPRGVIFDAGTLYVLHPPDLTAYHDDNGDGVADRSETLVKGIGFDLKFRGADHTTNGIRLGIDGYIYVAVGDYGFIKAVGKDGTTFPFRGGGVVRVRTDGIGPGGRLARSAEYLRRRDRPVYEPIHPRQHQRRRRLGRAARATSCRPGTWAIRRCSRTSPTRSSSLWPTMAAARRRDRSTCKSRGFPLLMAMHSTPASGAAKGVFRHPLEASGAGFTAGQEPFVMLPRPTDIDVDGSVAYLHFLVAGRDVYVCWSEGWLRDPGDWPQGSRMLARSPT